MRATHLSTLADYPVRKRPPSLAYVTVRVNGFNALIFLFAALINVFSYGSLAPAVVAILFFGATYSLLMLTPLGGNPERRIFGRVFAIGFLMAGLSAIYGNQLHDVDQFGSDAGLFFDWATDKSLGLSFLEIQVLFENALPVVIWRAIYNFFAALGFEKARHIGITVNVTAVALSGVFGIKIVRQVFGNDEYRFRRLSQLVAACGLFWLFAAVHMRDAMVLLAVTALIYVWIRFLVRPDLGWRTLQVVLYSVLAGATFGFLRGEFVFVPIALAIAAVAALFLGRAERWPRRRVMYGLIILGGVVVVALAVSFGADIMSALNRGKSSYSELSGDESGPNSLGMALIVNQNKLIRMALGSVYLFVNPIPFWSGFQHESVYHLFKSANAIFFYFVLPLLAMTLGQVVRQKSMRTPAVLFMVFVVTGFTLATAVSSLENRHLGAFLLPVFVLATVPDLRVYSHRQKYKRYLLIMLVGVFIVHSVWAVLKFLL